MCGFCQCHPTWCSQLRVEDGFFSEIIEWMFDICTSWPLVLCVLSWQHNRYCQCHFPHHSVQICVIYVDNLVTKCCLRCPNIKYYLDDTIGSSGCLVDIHSVYGWISLIEYWILSGRDHGIRQILTQCRHGLVWLSITSWKVGWLNSSKCQKGQKGVC